MYAHFGVSYRTKRRFSTAGLAVHVGNIPVESAGILLILLDLASQCSCSQFHKEHAMEKAQRP